MKAFVLSILVTFAAAALAAPSAIASTPPATTAAPAAPQLHAALRALWQGHVTHTRAYAMAVKAGDAGSAKTAADDVVANAKAIAEAVAGFYGKDAGTRMLQLLAAHWGAVKAMTDAQYAGNSVGNDAAMNDLTANASEIAKFLAGANPNLSEDAVKGLLVAHGGHHVAQIGEIMRGDNVAEAQTWKAMQMHMNVIADALADAIAKQFPAKAA